MESNQNYDTKSNGWSESPMAYMMNIASHIIWKIEDHYQLIFMLVAMVFMYYIYQDKKARMEKSKISLQLTDSKQSCALTSNTNGVTLKAE